jgi:hypothetical protein
MNTDNENTIVRHKNFTHLETERVLLSFAGHNIPKEVHNCLICHSKLLPGYYNFCSVECWDRYWKLTIDEIIELHKKSLKNNFL